jgi:hypothetical protein
LGAFKNRAIALQDIKLGTIGVILTDESRPAKLWQVQTIWGDGELTLIEPGKFWFGMGEDPQVEHAYPENFWPLLDSKLMV